MKQSEDFDRLLEQARATLQSKTAPPTLWNNIVSELERPAPVRSAWFRWQSWRIPALATVSLALLVALGIWLWQPTDRLISPARARQYAWAIDERVFDSQAAYELKIAGLEQQIKRLNLSATNDRWQRDFANVLVLDFQINECKTTLKYNPYNPTVHENLVAGYRYKIDRLNAILTESEKRHV
ncbi:MAG: hypothetical protein ABIA75_09705 [Candidatus Neomarinimicrobiota bacterium]